MAEYRLHVLGGVEGAPVRSSAPWISERDDETTRDTYLCGHCGVVLERGTAPPRRRTCFNCGSLNRGNTGGYARGVHQDTVPPVVIREAVSAHPRRIRETSDRDEPRQRQFAPISSTPEPDEREHTAAETAFEDPDRRRQGEERFDHLAHRYLELSKSASARDQQECSKLRSALMQLYVALHPEAGYRQHDEIDVVLRAQRRVR